MEEYNLIFDDKIIIVGYDILKKIPYFNSLINYNKYDEIEKNDIILDNKYELFEDLLLYFKDGIIKENSITKDKIEFYDFLMIDDLTKLWIEKSSNEYLVVNGIFTRDEIIFMDLKKNLDKSFFEIDEFDKYYNNFDIFDLENKKGKYNFIYFMLLKKYSFDLEKIIEYTNIEIIFEELCKLSTEDINCDMFEKIISKNVIILSFNILEYALLYFNLEMFKFVVDKYHYINEVNDIKMNILNFIAHCISSEEYIIDDDTQIYEKTKYLIDNYHIDFYNRDINGYNVIEKLSLYENFGSFSYDKCGSLEKKDKVIKLIELFLENKKFNINFKNKDGYYYEWIIENFLENLIDNDQENILKKIFNHKNFNIYNKVNEKYRFYDLFEREFYYYYKK